MRLTYQPGFVWASTEWYLVACFIFQEDDIWRYVSELAEANIYKYDEGSEPGSKVLGV